ncbi:SDR family NAD(P)-dependent oxidoreductase [Larkinella sp. C7]|jgi:NAD(P)-dependent dehydrogenase (short-subunit alcohol dehydrogenase family)|uniref:SDR family NAD(P)-dependent oxidoreductase n=1 Tax=Larkinella sp. C7 TaxID=2576607 RepID=UPI0011112D5C|nr:SDR family oxidoreductase [Larkinella sp. C7]
MKFKGKVVVITGATTGIGKATREHLAREGGIVYNLDIQKPTDDDTPGEFIPCDVRNKQEIKDGLAAVVAKENRIDMLFANAGIHLFATMEQTSDDELDNLININIKGTFHTVREVLPYMKAQRKGSIVLMGSDQTFTGKASSSVYGLTKGAIGQLTKSTAIDYAPFNIRVNCICPGTIDTPLLHKAVTHFSSINSVGEAGVYESLNTIQPLGRIGQPEEIAAVVAFLLSDDNSFMTGSLVSADGGYVCQ